MDLESKNNYRSRVEYIATRLKISEIHIAKKCVECATKGNTDKEKHIGYYLISDGKEELLKELAQAKIITEQKKEILQEKMKATSALEKLKELDKEEYDQLVNFEENEFIDDLATTHFKG